MTDKVKEVLWRVLADVDDRMEFAGTIWKSKESASKDVQKAIDQAAHQLNQMLIEARIEELEWQLAAIADKVKFKDWKWTIQSRLHELKAEKEK